MGTHMFSQMQSTIEYTLDEELWECEWALTDPASVYCIYPWQQTKGLISNGINQSDALGQ